MLVFAAQKSNNYELSAILRIWLAAKQGVFTL